VLLGWLEEAQKGEGVALAFSALGGVELLGFVVLAFPVILLSLGWWRGVGGA
jgi:hypothetical protein